MNTFRRLSLVGLTFCATLSAKAEINYPIQHQTDRFSSSLSRIQSVVDQTKPMTTLDQKVSYLDTSGIRETFTELQNIIRLYQSGETYQSLKDFYEPTKKFEDLISHVRDFKYFLDSAKMSGDQAAIAKYEAILQKEMAAYENFIATSGWFDAQSPMTARMTESLKAIQWPSLTEDRDFLLKQIAKRMKKIHEKEFNMKLVEEGIHELKRDARRLFYLDRAAKQILQMGPVPVCPLGQEVAKPEKNEVQSYQCAVSSCLTEKLYNAQYQLDSLKMQGLSYELKGEPVPSTITDAAEVVLKDLKDSNVFLHLHSQLMSCRSSGAQPEVNTATATEPDNR